MSVLKQTERLIYLILRKRKMVFFLGACAKITGTLGSLPVSDGR